MSSAEAQVPVALTIAGSDPSGGAGIQADLKTFTALGVYGATVITALTAQNTLGVTCVHGVPEAFIGRQIDAVAGDLRIGALKTGMLGDRATVAAVVAGIKRHGLRPLVVDPVMVATSGDVLLAPDAVEAVRGDLIPLARLITPNLHEAARLLDEPVAASLSALEDQARRLAKLGAGAVLVKGGHGAGPEAIDILIDEGVITRLSAPRIPTRNTHGTGCTLSAAITAWLAKGHTLAEAVSAAKAYLSRAIASGAALKIGAGNGPVDHLADLRDRTDTP